MKSLLAAGVALAALTTAAMADPVPLVPAQMDAVTAGATLQFGGQAVAQSAANPYVAIALTGGTANVNADAKSKVASGAAAAWAVCSGTGCAAATGIGAGFAPGTATLIPVGGGGVINVPGPVPITIVYQYIGGAVIE